MSDRAKRRDGPMDVYDERLDKAVKAFQRGLHKHSFVAMAHALNFCREMQAEPCICGGWIPMGEGVRIEECGESPICIRCQRHYEDAMRLREESAKAVGDGLPW